MTPAEWLQINLVLLAWNGILAMRSSVRWLKWFNTLMAASWCFWIGWNLSQVGYR